MSVSEAQFAAWVAEHYAAVYRRCYYLLGDADEADDAAQETFVRAYTARARYDASRPVRPWLLTIATRHCLDRLRARARRGPTLPWDAVPAAADPRPGPEAGLLAAEEAAAVRAAVAALPPLERALVVLHYWEDLPYAAIAAQTGLSVSAVKSRLYRARQRLARQLQDAAASAAADPSWSDARLPREEGVTRP